MEDALLPDVTGLEGTFMATGDGEERIFEEGKLDTTEAVSGIIYPVNGTSSRVMTRLAEVGLCVPTSTVKRFKEVLTKSAIDFQRITNRNDMIHATNAAVIGIDGEGINACEALDLEEGEGHIHCITGQRNGKTTVPDNSVKCQETQANFDYGTLLNVLIHFTYSALHSASALGLYKQEKERGGGLAPTYVMRTAKIIPFWYRYLSRDSEGTVTG
ncbi:hypothetical protein GYMLUDRAFT_65364 [Collybiopsis luxurians FD-317 M1]|uniref:Uncharacterized protein n=1 Tax=Collybiopsis luxurians FD-317 M1 TaxID=944289 RepID=A0A0D0C694_9AGAR|nr:hypothetical protein GYMLUDRAFT_65364 [Collybiopsis luxurians FD-317 M1]